jgi:hypothetical protein
MIQQNGWRFISEEDSASNAGFDRMFKLSGGKFNDPGNGRLYAGPTGSYWVNVYVDDRLTNVLMIITIRRPSSSTN